MTESNIVFLQSIIGNLYEDFMELTAITSRVRAYLKSEQRPFGAGKSTLAFQLSYMLHYIDEYGLESLYSIEPMDMRIWDRVFQHAVYTIDDLVEMLLSTSLGDRIPCIVWDDAQLTAPAVNVIPPELKEKINFLTTARPYVANIIMTAPSLKDLARPLREKIKYEVIVPRRGVYEVQMIERRKNYYRPTLDLDRLIFVGIGSYPPLPKPIQERYNQWRDSELKKYMAKKLGKAPAASDNKRYVPVHEATKILKIAERTVQKYCKQGELECIKIKGKWYVAVEAKPTTAMIRAP